MTRHLGTFEGARASAGAVSPEGDWSNPCEVLIGLGAMWLIIVVGFWVLP
jgi:hypothetical protein